MTLVADVQLKRRVDEIYRTESRRVLATPIRQLGDFAVAEEALHEAFIAALEHWESEGIPANPRAWLVTTARNKAIDRLRRRSKWEADVEDVDTLLENVAAEEAPDAASVEDDRLRLVFTCCHPALAQEAQVALTLRLLCGLTTAEGGRGFLVPDATMAARITRAKKKIAGARIPYAVPPAADLPGRVDAVLTVVHLLFAAG